jgi:hypothetical protein
MRFSATFLSVVAATSLTLTPVFANAGPAGKPQKSGKPATIGRPTTSGKPTTTAKPTKSPSGKPPTSVKPAKPTSGKPAATTSHMTKSGSKSASTHTRSTSGSTTLNPIAEKIASKPNLSKKLSALLPIDSLTGKTMTLDTASLGFKNQGQFIAALHVSQNLGIPFTELKSHMVTLTPGAPGEQPTATQTGSLGQAIQRSKATANVTTEIQKAEMQAAVDLQISASTTTTRTTTPKGGVR